LTEAELIAQQEELFRSAGEKYQPGTDGLDTDMKEEA